MRPAITSLQNPRVRWLRRLVQDPKARRRERLWVAEGLRLAEEVIQEALAVRLWALTPAWGEDDAREQRVRAVIEGGAEEALVVSAGLFRDLAGTRSPQGVLCVVEAPCWTCDAVLAGEGPLLVLDRVQDPGNLGTLARSAEAAGASGLFLTPGSVDPGNPKALRASAGSLLRLPWFVAEDPVHTLVSSGRLLAATAGAGGTSCFDADLARPLALLLGQEGGGLAPDLARAAQVTLTVPMESRVESLNVATAAAVILFEAARQRRVRRSVPTG